MLSAGAQHARIIDLLRCAFILLDFRADGAQSELARMKLADCPISYASYSFLA